MDAPPPKGVVHVGAHHGQEIGEYQSYAPEVLVWIEANPRAYVYLQGFLASWDLPGTSHWCLNALISDVDGEMHDFHIANNDAQASSMFPSTELLRARYPKGSPTGEIMRLEMRTLKSVLAELKLSPAEIDYLVLDTQGAEMKCFGGLGDYIDNLRYITAEVSTAELYTGGAQMHELDEYLEPRGFFRVSSEPTQSQHGDMLYVRMDEESRQPHRQLSEADSAREISMRTAFNGVIGTINDNIKNNVGESVASEIEDELVRIQDEFSDILVLPCSRNICSGLARFSFDAGYARAFPAFFLALGWR